MKIKWTDKIKNKELWRITQQKSIENQIKRRKWNWIGHNYITQRNRSNRENRIRLESKAI
jgi:hypothetical protein